LHLFSLGESYSSIVSLPRVSATASEAAPLWFRAI
jgi:hypothetical protein